MKTKIMVFIIREFWHEMGKGISLALEAQNKRKFKIKKWLKLKVDR